MRELRRLPALLPLLLFGSGLLVPSVSPAMTLEDCLAAARRNAPSLQVSEAAVERAEAAVREARAALRPTVTLNASYLQNNEAQKAVFQIPGTNERQVIKMGSATSVDVRTEAQIHLYTGGRDAALIEVAQATSAGRKLSLAQAESDLVLRVSQAYFRAVAAQRLEAAARDAVTTATAHLSISGARVRAGVAARLDSLRAQVDLSGRNTALLRALEAVRLTRVDLETAIGAPVPLTETLAEPGEPGQPGEPSRSIEPVASDSLGQIALRSRPELAELDQAIRETDQRILAARAGRRPQLNANATAAYVAPNRNEDYLEWKETGLKTYRLFAGVALSVPILDGGLTRARVDELEADRRSLEAQKREVALGVQSEVENAASDLRVMLAVWQSSAGRVAASAEALRLAEAGYKGGTSTATDVRDAETTLADARAEEAQSLMDYWTARVALDHAIGAGLSRKDE